jgi:hypothetical protein
VAGVGRLHLQWRSTRPCSGLATTAATTTVATATLPSATTTVGGGRPEVAELLANLGIEGVLEGDDLGTARVG